MSYTTINTETFLKAIAPFDQLSENALSKVSQQTQLLRYRMGQTIVMREKIPAVIYIIFEGQARLLGYDPKSQMPVTLKLLQPGDILGWVGLIRGVGCETAIASSETICLTIKATEFLTLVQQEKAFASYFHNRPELIEVFDLLAAELQSHANNELLLEATNSNSLKELALKVHSEVTIVNLTEDSQSELPSDRLWLVSGGSIPEAIATRYNPQTHLTKAKHLRLLGFPANILPTPPLPPSPTPPLPTSHDDIPYAPQEPEGTHVETSNLKKYPYVRGSGRIDAVLACFQMLSKQLNLPFRREVLRKVLQNQERRTGSLSLQQCGAIAESLGLNAQLISLPVNAVGRLQAPAIVQWQDSFALLYEINTQAIVLGIPEVGVLRQKTADVASILLQSATKPDESPKEAVPVLLLQQTRYTPQQKFGLSWFLPSLYKYRQVLIEVFIASFFVQLFGLANPLMTQVIIDKVLVQNSAETLQVLGIFLIVIAVFEAILTSIRTYLFVDTTNRIDLALGSQIIDHLLRLPLRYFERRPVGELSTRVNELENIRQFLTGTALTVVLDAVFSVIYIVVMFIYSWLLSLVALSTLPLFVLLTTVVSPIVRRQLRSKAERNAEAQSHLVEVLSGIQTVKAQNIELRSRWQWQERYARYVSAGFKTVQTSTAAGSTSNFLSQLSSLLVLWVGAYLVLKGELTLGQLIAFRIIAGYVTSPLLRLTQLWQNFQETALSLERLSDIIDSPTESSESDRGNIPMPMIQGSVKYDNVSFRFNPSGALQLNNINLEFPAGIFVGIVGQSGSGKSTLMKLLPRLYPLESGRILIDGYDINKVELYSLRKQIGIVPQDTLLFDGTIQENIALNHPDASSEEIIEAAKIAFAHEFIMNLPNGYNTRVGERGASLSGGQRQRIAIARTILQNPQMLILDEATSALDYESERQVCLNLAEAFKGRTVFFITHRLSTIRNAELILMLDQGFVVEQGTHQQLMTEKGRYYCLYQQQEAQL
ncbi:cyclic nucleotide-regulated ABC bacteriocin/lantibiotic exporter [Tolypothrix sp. NIES-4075]|uniref:peptidase domain-containing ABC transporter n=1 Tax=Tolypothrix sp. NIES-4075 TaxID=2005459 RepID=UPI000B5C7C47|nr:peptidase domain-containing ABC transporter [Tolypothrix sp. NIES-4075]GAX41861.1 cyclic nucleotide-regulated ABC bacteriocin/lantibiotic exporter [Tolypothrix sp. NIES-4075]